MTVITNKKNALVFGASAGIGKAIAIELYKAGHNVCIASRSEEKLKIAVSEISALQSSGKIIYTTCDVAKKDQINSTVDFFKKNYGTVDILINNQGGPIPGGFNAIDEEQLQEALNTNLMSFFRATKLCIEEMKLQRWGRIVNVLSISAKEPLPNMLLSNMIRPAILGMSKTIAQEYAQFGVTINSVLPSAVLTDRTFTLLSAKAKSEGRDYNDVLKDATATLPSKYMSSPEEFAQIVGFLCSQGSSYINGAAIPVDGASSKSLY